MTITTRDGKRILLAKLSDLETIWYGLRALGQRQNQNEYQNLNAEQRERLPNLALDLHSIISTARTERAETIEAEREEEPAHDETESPTSQT